MYEQLALPVIGPPVLSIQHLRKALGGARRIQALDRRKPEDRVDVVLSRVLVTALEAGDTRIRYSAQSLGVMAGFGKPEEQRVLWHLSAAELYGFGSPGAIRFPER